MGTAGNWIGELGGAVGSLFQAEGNTAEANSYTSAAQLDEQNAQLTEASTQIQAYQEARTVAMSEGTTAADVAGAGFTTSGSALDILKSSAQQGALATGLVNIQGAVSENAYAAEAGANLAKAKAANEANTAGTISAIASIGGALVNGTTSLASAGQSVYQGVSSIFSPSIESGTALAQTTSAADAYAMLSGSAQTNAATEGFGGYSGALTTNAATDGFGGYGSGFGLDSATDSEISGTITADTSGVGIGTAASDVTSALSSVGSDIAAAGPVATIAEVGAQLDKMIPGLGNFNNTFGLNFGVSDAINSAVSTAENAVSDVVSGVTSISVICTALYSQKHISLKAWLSAQQYGAKVDSSTFAGYLYWASPIADRIRKDKVFAKRVAPFFIPMIEQMGVIMKRPEAKRTVYGFISHRLLFGVSHAIGYLIRERYVNSRA